jgi:endonuclease/exonuclease/phosphatase family metal-dependent hydrolase
LAAWAGARLAGADRLRRAEGWVVPSLSFTPQVAAAAVAALPLMRGGRSRGVATLAAAALTAAVAPRAIPRPQPRADGAELRVLTSNLLVGRADAESLVRLVVSMRADVLFLQELTEGAATRLEKAGLDSVLPYHVLEPVGHGPKGSGIWARHPLRDGLTVPRASRSRPVARLEVPGGQSVQLVCVHLRPPRPSHSPSGAARWRAEMAMLPGPGDIPVIMAGDFNATLDHAQFRALLRLGYVDAAVQAGRGLVPTWGPRPGGELAMLALDHVLLDPRCAVRAVSAHKLPGTDHRALYAQIRLPG